MGSPYVGAMRYDIHFRDESILIPGVRYSHTITGGNVVPTVPGAATVPLTAYDLVEGYVQTTYSGTSLLLGAGYAGGINAATYRASARRPLTNRLTAMVQANYTENGDWNGFFGLSYDLNGGGSNDLGCATCQARALRPGTIVRAQNQGTMTLGELRDFVGLEDDAFELKSAIDSLVNEFGRNQLIPSDVGFRIIREAEEVDDSREDNSNSDSDRSSGGDSEVFAEIEDLREALRKNPQKFGVAANQQLLDALFQQGLLGNFVKQTTGGGMSNCPPAYPFRLISGGMCFCCDNAAGTGACISCPP